MTKHGLKRFFKPILILVSPGYARCKHCGLPGDVYPTWRLVKEHETTMQEYNRADGKAMTRTSCFVVCEHCWQELMDRGPDGRNTLRIYYSDSLARYGWKESRFELMDMLQTDMERYYLKERLR